MLETIHTLRVLLIAALIAGCSHWEKSGATDAELQTANSVCQAKASSQFPPKMEMSCKWVSKSCFKDDPFCVGGWKNDHECRNDDINASRHAEVFKSCMQEGGWQEVY
jgi:hypothetical protein